MNVRAWLKNEVRMVGVDSVIHRCGSIIDEDDMVHDAEEIELDYGSGVLDSTGREIFERDVIIDRDGNEYYCVFGLGAFYAVAQNAPVEDQPRRLLHTVQDRVIIRRCK
jgi:hypothetical protein